MANWSIVRICMVGLTLATVLGGCAKPNPLDESRTDKPDSSSTMRQVTVRLDLARISVLGRRLTMTPTRLLLQFRSDSSVFRDTVAISGSGLFTKTYTLSVAAETLTVEGRDQRDSVLYRGTSTFSVIDTAPTVVALSLSPRYSSLSMHLPGLDSMTRVVLGVDGATWFDSLGGFPDRAGSVDLSRDYLPASPTGVEHRFSLEVRGVYQGVDAVLYRLDTTIAIVAGADTVRTLPLHWAGPPGPGQIGLSVLLGNVGQVEFRIRYDSTGFARDTVSFFRRHRTCRSVAMLDVPYTKSPVPENG